MATVLAISGVELFENMIQVLWVQYMVAWNKAFLAYWIAPFLHWNKLTFENLGYNCLYPDQNENVSAEH
jgi:hypothetical protein